MTEETFQGVAIKELHTSLILGEDANSPVVIGNSSAYAFVSSEDDLFVSRKLEVQENAFFIGNISIQARATLYPNQILQLGTTSVTVNGAIEAYDSGQTVATTLFMTGSTSRSIIFCDGADQAIDWGHSQQTNPTLYIHSADGTNVADWVSIAHDQTDGVIDCGQGTLNLGATGNVNFAGATHTGTGDTVTNGYVTMEVAGASIKFATIA